MGFKTITIKEDVYRELLRAKGNDESFSDFLDELVKEKKKKPDISKYYGAWKMGEKEWKRVESAIKKNRELADRNYKEKLDRLFR